MKKYLYSIIASASISPLFALALTNPDSQLPPASSTKITSVTGIYELLSILVNWFFTFVLVIAVVMFIWAGLIYITAGGDSGKTEQAKNMIIYAVVGVAVALMAQAFIWIASDIVGISSTPTSLF